MILVEANGGLIDLFIRRYHESDKKLHLFNWRESKDRFYFPEGEMRAAWNNDLGTVELPEGKTSRNQLAKGDILSIYKDGKPDGFNGAKYISDVY